MSSVRQPPWAKRVLIAAVGRPVWLALALREKAWRAACLPFRWARAPAPVKLGFAVTRRWNDAHNDFLGWDGMLFRASVDFPRAGWSSRACLAGWGSVDSMSPRQAALLNALLRAPGLDWAGPQSDDDLGALLDAKARFVAGHANSAMGGKFVLDSIPPSRPDLADRFRRATAKLDPNWHHRDDHFHPTMLSLSRKNEWREPLERMRLGQEAFLQAEQIAGGLAPEPLPAHGAARPRSPRI